MTHKSQLGGQVILGSFSKFAATPFEPKMETGPNNHQQAGAAESTQDAWLEHSVMPRLVTGYDAITSRDVTMPKRRDVTH